MKKSIKVLIVDDEPQNVQIMREILSFHPKYDCIGANSGEEALSILKSYSPEIILLDVMMPGINGYEVCRQIREHTEHKFAKIIMVSGMSMVDDRLKGYGAGADDYLTKPYVESELIAKLEVYSKLSRIEEVDTLKTTALNILSHETRTPLNGILLGSELLREMEEVLPDKAKLYIDLVHESGLRIQELVEKISRYYCIKDGIEKSLTKNSLSYLLNKLMEELCSSGMEDKVQVNCDCANAVHFTADWLLLKEAVLYVVDNATKSTSGTGLISINCLKTDEGVCLQVGDRGPGIPESMTKRVFDSLFSPDILHHTQGTGLGLAIAKEIVEEHGGRITCSNREGGGTLFEIFLQISS